MKNFTFKVFPVPPGQPNRRAIFPYPERVQAKEAKSVSEQDIPLKEDQGDPTAAPQEPCPPPKKPGTVPPCPPMMPSPEFPQAPFAAPPFLPFPGPSPVAPYTVPPGCPQFPQYQGPGYPPAQERIAHAYVPWQHYNVVFSPSEALNKGTLFPELFQPQGIYGPCEGPQPCYTYFPVGGGPHGCN